MPSCPRIASVLILSLAACAHEAESPSPVSISVPDDAVYRGELVLHGDSGILESGSASIAICAVGESDPLMARSWDIGDLAWRVGPDEMRLYFALDKRDAWPGAVGRVGERMDLVARFDPDGNPATDEPGSVQARTVVRTGAHDLRVDLSIGVPVAATSHSSGG